MEKMSFLKRYRVTLVAVLLMSLAYAAFRLLGFSVLYVSGNSMSPTYNNGDLVITKSFSKEEQLLGNPVCWVVNPEGKYVLKRLIGYPNDVVTLEGEDTYVNGKLLMRIVGIEGDSLTFVLGGEQYLFLGDNRDESRDSRHWVPQCISEEKIKGVVVFSRINRR